MGKISTIEDLKKELKRLSSILPVESMNYYQLSLFADEKKEFHYTYASHFAGFTEGTPRRELRAPSLVDAHNTLDAFSAIGEPVFVINTEDDFIFFIFVIGGNAMIEKNIFEKYLPHLLTPSASAYTFGKGFKSIQSVSKEQLRRFADPKLRMKIFNRDKRRCRICGANPETNEHVELHLHHITPYSIGGLTEENNLVTLCQKCHKGLPPGTDYTLFNYTDANVFDIERSTSASFNKKLLINILANEHRRKQYHKTSVRNKKS